MKRKVAYRSLDKVGMESRWRGNNRERKKKDNPGFPLERK